MITQEMVLAAKNAENNVAALIAVYPLILEQAAEKCFSLVNKPNFPDEFTSGCNTGIMECFTAIRNLKDKTDEARNG